MVGINIISGGKWAVHIILNGVDIIFAIINIINVVVKVIEYLVKIIHGKAFPGEIIRFHTITILVIWAETLNTLLMGEGLF